MSSFHYHPSTRVTPNNSSPERTPTLSQTVPKDCQEEFSLGNHWRRDPWKTISLWSGLGLLSSRGLSCLALLCVLAQGGVARAQSCGGSIVCENSLPGNTGWDAGGGDPTVQGFATDISVNVGQTIFFKIKTNAASYHLDIYRLGYYGGTGARKITTVNPSVSLPQTQPACLTDAATKLIDCGNWAISASWPVPSTVTSGIYFGNIIRPDTGGTSQIFFVVRNDAGHSNILFQTSDETWAAYNDYGGRSLYGGAGTFDLNNRAFKVSYNRPFDTRNFEAATFLFSAEYPMIRWLEANGYDVSYFTGIDAARNASLIANHKIYLTVGHGEYVSGPERANLETARDAGVHMAFFSGNELFWQTRFENSIDGTNTPYRTIVCYKETYFGTGTLYQRDPNDPPTWTGTWADSTFSPPANGGRPQNSLTGTEFAINGPGPDNSNLSIQVPAADGKMRFWRNTSVATLGSGQTASLPGGTLGYEWDVDLDNGFRPAGLVPLSTSTYTMTDDLLLDYGATYGAGIATHHLSMYRAPSGAIVFGAGTVQWSWGLDSNHDGGSTPPDIRMQQATVNLFADMGTQPATLQPGLVTAAKSTDTTPPTTTIVSPALGSTVQYGLPISVTGNAADSGGGVVGAVEVSIDQGQTWHRAAGREQWSYSWTPYSPSGSATVMVRASDDSGNLQATPTTTSYTVSGDPTCPCSIWSSSTLPGTPSANDPTPVELGLRFRSDVPGVVSGIKFYKGSANPGPHIGNLWTNSRAKLATVNFTNETPSGWQQANFSSPISILADTTYVVSYYAPNGGYAVDAATFLSSGVNNPPLHALATGVDGRNGVYLYAPGGGFPSNTFNESNYWVDLVFTPSPTASVSGTVSGGSGATVTLSGSANATTTADGAGKYIFANLANGTYTITPSKTGVTFTPASATVTVNGTKVIGMNFTANGVATWSVSGNINGAGSGVSVTLSGAIDSMVITDASGNYSFAGLANGSYSVAPTKSGFSFAPPTAPITVNGASITGINFTGTALPTWSVSGHITGATSVAVTLSGAASANQTSDGLDNYSFTGLLNGTYTITANKIGFLINPPSQTVTVNAANVSAVNFSASQASSVWSNSTIPGTSASNDASAVELGLKFRSDVPGSIQGVRFYKGLTNTGSHVGNLWSNAGTKLASVTFAAESSSGWQQANFSSPVAISANTTYIISYFAPNGHYAADQNFFLSTTVNNPPLHALADGSDGGNGVYLYASTGGFPVNTFGSTNYWVDVIFTTTTTWSISGTITNGTGATVTLSGAATATVTADTSGNYSFPGLSNGTYTVTPSKAGFTFAPASAPATVSSANVTAVNFVGTATTWSISGTITNGSGATVTLSGAATATVTADTSGNYSLPGLANGSYTVTPTKAGFTFAPASSPATVSSANVTAVNFVGTATTWSISGTITNGSGATVTLSGAATATVTADTSGNYSFPGLSNGAYTVTPSKAGFTFAPASTPATVSSANVTAVNFVGTATTWSISGTITNGSGATVTLSGAATATVTADTSGNYSFPGLANGSYTVTPTRAGFTFAPASAPATVSSANVTAVNFVGTATTWSISGIITNGSGATVTLSGGATATVTADTSGNYIFPGLANGSYTVTPTKAGFTFAPASAPATVSSANVTAVNFVATATTWSISGTITNGSGATVALSGTAAATVTANASGAYTFSGLANGGYTVTPSKAGFSFAPASAPATVSSANVTAVNFVGTATTWSVSGTITNGSGATITLSGAAAATVTADASGNYSFPGLANGSYTLTPTKTGFTFAPASTPVTVNGASVAGVNFTGKPPLAIDLKVSVNQATASSTIMAPNLSTTAGDELLLAFVSTDYLSGANTVVSGVAGAGLTWALVIRTNTQSGTAEIWRAFATSPLVNAAVTATLSHSVVSSLTVVSITGADSSGTSGSGAIGAIKSSSASLGPPTATLVTTRNNSWVFGVGNDYDNAIARTPGTGQSLINQYLTPTGDTYWVQMQNSPTPASGTTVTINDIAPTADRYNLSICEILRAP